MDIAGIKWSILVMILITVIMEIFLNKSRHLRQLYYIGHNVDTTALYRLSTGRVKCICFGVSAAVVSGASIFGGKGSIARTMLGVLFIFTPQNGMTAYKVNTYVQQIILGAILIAAIYLDLRVNAKREG